MHAKNLQVYLLFCIFAAFTTRIHILYIESIMNKPLLTLVILFVMALNASAQKSRKMMENYLFQKGVELYSQDTPDYAGALEAFSKELQNNPKNGYAAASIAQIYKDQQDWGKSVTGWSRAIALVEKLKDKEYLSRCYELRGDTYMAMGEPEKARQDWAKALIFNPKNAGAMISMFNTFERDSMLNEAETVAKMLLKVAPEKSWGYTAMGHVLMMRHRYEEAVAKMDYSIKLEDDNAGLYSTRADAYLKMGKSAEAVDDIIQALSLAHDDDAFSLMQDLKGDGRELMIAKLRVQQNKTPNDEYWYYCEGVIYESNKEYNKAVELYRKAMELKNSPVFSYRISQCYLECNQVAPALDYINRAVALDSTDVDFLLHKAEVLRKMGRAEEAMPCIDEVVQQAPENPGVYFLRGNYRYFAKDMKGAADDLSMAITLSKAQRLEGSWLYHRALAYKALGEEEKAKADLQLLLDSVKDDRDYRAYAYQRLGRRDEMQQELTALLDSTRSKGTLYNVACIYALDGKAEKAMAILTEAVDSGYTDALHMMVDEDLTTLRERPDFKALVKRLMEKTHIDTLNVPQKVAALVTTRVPFTRQNGVTHVQCSINGLPLNFVFDTGASDVTLSMVEATFMMKNNYINERDVVGSSMYMDANGNVSEGTTLVLRKVEFGGLELHNVRASVVRNQRAPLLLGQSVLSRLGSVEIDNKNNELIIKH